MKKTYEAPKAERMEFNYSDVVAASGCIETSTWTLNKKGPCMEQEIFYTSNDN